jgi:hypothetical protein
VPSPAPAGITEAQSKKRCQELAQAICRRFPTTMENGRPEGFQKAYDLLTKTFKVARLDDLDHEMRLGFIKEVENILTQAAGK